MAVRAWPVQDLAFLLTTPSRHGRHCVEASRRLVAWSRSSSGIRRQLGFVKDDDDDLIDIGEDDDGAVWIIARILAYRWTRDDAGRWAYRLKYICMPEATADSGG